MTGCSWFQEAPEIEVRTIPVEMQVYQPPRPAGAELNTPKWYVVTEDNLDEFLAELRRLQDADPVFFAFTPKDYEMMSFNVQELRRLVLEYINLVEYYEDVTEPEDESSSSIEKETSN